jgi:phosphate:Na+ symporter
MELSIAILGGLALFLYGMKILSEALQGAADDKLERILWRFTNNRFKGVLTGLAITSVIQSSSATTVMLVSFVNAGLINLTQAIGIIFGANIGTTVTGWIVAMIGFKIKVTALALPAIGIGFFIRFFNSERVKQWGNVLLGFGILFLGLSIMSDSVKDLRDSPMIMEFMGRYRADTFFSTIFVVLIGTAVTFVIQSSSATMAMTMTLAFNGIIDFNTACALILGENIGTTITAYLAALGSSVNARRAARVHMLFNVFGVIWILFILKIFYLPFIDFIVPGDPYSADAAVRASAIPDHMAAFHTIFNVINTIIFLPLVGFLAYIVTRMIPDKAPGADGEFHLKYISTSLLATPSMNINQAKLESKRMVGLALQMYTRVIELYKNPTAKLGSRVEEILTMENHIDQLEVEISTFLVRVSQESISEEQSHDISSLLHRVNEIEKIGDHCENLLKIARRKYDSKVEFSPDAAFQIDEIAGRVEEFLSLIEESIGGSNVNIIARADIIENRINELRKELRKNHIKRLNQGLCDATSALLFIDMLSSFEKIGDHAFNIAEGISGLRIF